MDSRVYVLISGRVQGVFFRTSAKKKADKMVEWCRKGPDYADVADVQVISEKYIGEFKDFSVLR